MVSVQKFPRVGEEVCRLLAYVEVCAVPVFRPVVIEDLMILQMNN